MIKAHRVITVVCAVIAVSLVLGLVYMAITTVPVYGARATPEFHNGEMVRMRAFGHIGMVIGNRCYREHEGKPGYCTYTVRFSAIQSNTNTRVFGADGPIDVAPVASVRGVREYELERVQ
jgi:hypothetical protein